MDGSVKRVFNFLSFPASFFKEGITWMETNSHDSIKAVIGSMKGQGCIYNILAYI